MNVKIIILNFYIEFKRIKCLKIVEYLKWWTRKYKQMEKK